MTKSEVKSLSTDAVHGVGDCISIKLRLEAAFAGDPPAMGAAKGE